MAKQQMYQRYIYKIHSGDIIKAKYKLKLSVADARSRQEIITLADSQVLRFIDDINGVDRGRESKQYHQLLRELKRLRRADKNAENRKLVKQIYEDMEKIQFVSDYLCVVMDKPDDIYKLRNGFSLNGKRFARLVGTSNGVKKSIIVYSSLTDELNLRLNNGRDESIELVPSKFEAYKGLACSASIPLSEPRGVLVVNDFELTFRDKVIELRDNEGSSPIMEEKETEIQLNANDGFGLMSPDLARRWGDDLHINYLMSGCCIRNAFTKGMAYTFDFHRFAIQVAGKDTVKDVWGNEHNIHDIDLILTASMLKLWDSYGSYEEYAANYKKNGYTFATTKVCPETLDNVRTLNYQFIQSYELSDSDIYDLISPTVTEIKSVLHADVNKTLLFLRGMGVDGSNVLDELENDYVKALMIDKRMLGDPYVIDKINSMIRKKINDAKIGVVSVRGNYQMLSGDPYALCEHIFGLVSDTSQAGLLKAGELYSNYWVQQNVNQVVCFRAPMTCMNNIRKMKVASGGELQDWYQYMRTVIILNCHDTTTHALNGADMD